MRKKLILVVSSLAISTAAHAAGPYVQMHDISTGLGATATEHSVALARVTFDSESGGPASQQNIAYEIDRKGGNGSHSIEQGIEDALIGMKTGGERLAHITMAPGVTTDVHIVLLDVAKTIDELSGRNADYTLAEIPESTPQNLPESTYSSTTVAPRNDPGSFSNLPSTPLPLSPAPAQHGYAPSYPDSLSPEPSYVQPSYAPPPPEAVTRDAEPFTGGPSLRDEFPAPAEPYHDTSEFYNRGGQSEFYNQGGQSEFQNQGGTTEFYGHDEHSEFNHQGSSE